MSNFVHLHNHMEGSIADSALRIKDAVSKAKEFGMEALAITDHGNMFKVVEFYKECKKQGIKPIIGMEAYVAPRHNTLKEYKVDDKNYHLVLLCKSEEGYRNLIQISSDAYEQGFYGRPRTDKWKLRKYHDGIIASSACLGGEVQELFLNGYEKEAEEAALMYDDIFGRGNFFLELQDHGMEEQHKVNAFLIKLSKKTGIPLVCTNDCHYLTSESAKAHDILMAIQAKVTVDSDKRKKYSGDQFYLKSSEEMESLFKDFPEALANTKRIADQCDITFEFGKNKIPQFLDVPQGETPSSYLRQLAFTGAKERYGEITPVVKERLEYELSVIEKMQYIDYFLIVWDFINYGRKVGMIPSPGRGSGAGSIVLYSLYVTHLDPLENGLLFERESLRSLNSVKQGMH